MPVIKPDQKVEKLHPKDYGTNTVKAEEPGPDTKVDAIVNNPATIV